ncbi:MAG: helix-hairpin-helix domain-containing protein [Moraxellaceae bacterium]|nr:helix-hairpin-helix domain-containing protein [Moraxellaceae bacterium]
MVTTSLFANNSSISLGQHCAYVLYPEHLQLSAEICVSEPTQQAVSVQLWACQQPCSGSVVQGHLIAATSETHYQQSTIIEETLTGSWPVGQSNYYMVLALVQADTLISYVNFEQTQVFLQPYLNTPSIEFMPSEAVIEVAQIFNPRAMDNLSGTLSLELWALSAPYVFDSCEGELLTIELLGELYGQNFWAGYQLKTPLPIQGKQLALLLREWTAKGYVTRDIVTFDIPVASSLAKAKVSQRVLKRPKAIAETKATTELSQEVKTKAKAAASKKTKAKSASTKNIAALNNAELADLMAIKGVSQTVATNILQAKPYQSWQEVGQIKGVGGKVLQKLQEAFSA